MNSTPQTPTLKGQISHRLIIFQQICDDNPSGENHIHTSGTWQT